MRFSTLLSSRPALALHNTLSGSSDIFELPRGVNRVRMYNCGPTVYDVQHIGNLGMFVFTDILRRTLEYNDFEVKQVINFTDVGHLQGDNRGDADQGEDRMTRALEREGLDLTLENMKTLGKKYADIFLHDLDSLGIDTQRITFPYASDYIAADIAMVQTLEEKGYAYQASQGVYYDTSRFADYGALGNIDLEGQRQGARVESDPEKRNPTDFLLWKFDPQIGWDSPWGKGFPGWHIECSAMIRTVLGEKIDIHTGGIEHIPVHHNNEIAQSEAATGKKPLSRFWLHRAHIQMNGKKISKSEGNVVYLSDIVARDFHPLSVRYLFLGAHYRTPSNFTWEALRASDIALKRLAAYTDAPEGGTVPQKYQRRFLRRINDDLDTAGALAILWDMVKNKRLSPADIRAGLLDADRILGLHLLEIPRASGVVSKQQLPNELAKLFDEREAARTHKNFARSDEIRNTFAAQGYTLNDTPEGTVIEKST